MRCARWITKATNTRTYYLILIAYLWQQWLCQHTYMLCEHTYMLCEHTCMLFYMYHYLSIAYLVHYHNLKYSFKIMVTSSLRPPPDEITDLQHIRSTHPPDQCHILQDLNLHNVMNG